MKKLISTVAAAAVLTTGAFAVGANTDSRGNYLVSPAYMAFSGYETDFEVFNTSSDTAYVAKVVVREGQCSQELKDFLLFLSPGDVFRGKIKDVGGKILLSSDDDSISSTGNVATEIKAGKDLLENSTHLNNFNMHAKYGYIEVFTLLEMDAKELYEDFQPGKPLPKSIIENFYKETTKALRLAGVDFTASAADLNLTGYDGNITALPLIEVRPNPNKLEVNASKVIGGPTGLADLNISLSPLTGTVTLSNSNLNQAMTTAMYGVNLDGVRNRIFGEESKETNYLRVYGGDLNTSRGALKTLAGALEKDEIYVPYAKGQESILNLLFLAKNQSNYKCNFYTAGGKNLVQKFPIKYKALVRDTKENSSVKGATGWSGEVDGTSSVANELAQINIKSIVDTSPLNADNGWITIELENKAAPMKYGYDTNLTQVYGTPSNPLNGPVAIRAAADFNTSIQAPAVLPSYMQVLPAGTAKFTNMYVPASQDPNPNN